MTCAPRLPFTRGLVEDESGIAAIEFSILAPLIVGLYMGLAELSFALSIKQHVEASASVAGDLITQANDITDDDMADVIAATLAVAQVRNQGPYTMRAMSFERDGDDIVNRGTAEYNPQLSDLLGDYDVSNLGPEILPDGAGIVVVQTAFRHKPFGFRNTIVTNGEKTKKGFFKSSVTLRNTAFYVPRGNGVVNIGDDPNQTMNCTGYGNSTSCTSSGSTDSGPSGGNNSATTNTNG